MISQDVATIQHDDSDTCIRYGTPLLPPGDCVLAIESTPRYILCIYHYIGCI